MSETSYLSANIRYGGPRLSLKCAELQWALHSIKSGCSRIFYSKLQADLEGDLEMVPITNLILLVGNWCLRALPHRIVRCLISTFRKDMSLHVL